MAKVRIYVLARELDVSSSDLLARLKKDGHDVGTASSSIDEDVAARYRKELGGAGQAAAPPSAPALPPPKPIVRRARAVKPKPRKPQTEEELAAAEERRQARLARLRGEFPGEGSEEEEEAFDSELAEATEQEPAEQQVAQETSSVSASPAESVEAPSHLVERPAPQSTGPSLPRLLRPAPSPTAEPVPPKPPERPAEIAEPASPAVTSPPAARSTREFRGPIRKIELPPQPPRPAASPYGRPQPPGIRTYSQRPGTGLGKHKKRKNRKGAAAAQAPAPAVAPVPKGEGQGLRLTEGVTVKELADKMDVKAKDIIKILMQRGMMVTVNVALEPDVAKKLAEDFGYKPEVVSFEEDLQAQEEEQVLEAMIASGEEDDVEEERPPVVTVMGHVDHGKTSLLDYIRKTNVAAGEAGGITQSIGAYQVQLGDRAVTFVDTPGHEAFTSMRARGAQVTDLVVLVVSATDSVMPQTVEAINHAKAAGVPVIIAINKIDLPNARPEKVKQDLMSHDIVVEQYGGEVVTVECSATKGTGVSDLLDLILLTSEMKGLKANPSRRATGTVLEAGIDRGKGATANIIVQDGTLRLGDAFIVGSELGRVRALENDRGERIDSAGPSMPVQVMGLAGVPNAGDRFQVVESEAQAREISEFRQHKRREAEIAKSGVARGSLQDLSRAIAEGEAKELAVLIKADVHGAVEVLSKTVEELSTPKVKTKIVHSGTGAITDSDVLLASASDAIIVGFNVRPERSAAELAEREKVIIRLHTVIYHLTEELRDLMAGLLDAIREEEFLGRAEVRQTFKVPKIGMVAGCYVQDGKIVRNAEARLVRDGVVVWEGKLSSLKRFKEDAREVASGMECGIGLQDFNDIKVGDAIEAFFMKEVRQTLE